MKTLQAPLAVEITTKEEVTADEIARSKDSLEAHTALLDKCEQAKMPFAEKVRLKIFVTH